MLILYWDIDGTLLSTARAGVPALEDGFEAVLGVRPSLMEMDTSGLTDRMIVRLVLTELGHEADHEVESSVLRAYTDALPHRLTQRRGWVMPGVTALLADLAARDDVASVLLTGNMLAGARAKLASYGLDRYFMIGGFAEDGYDRRSIALAAMRRAARAWGEVAATNGIIIGDTTFDVQAGLAVGLRVIAVCTGTHSRTELERAGSTWVVDTLPDCRAILRLAADGKTQVYVP